MRHTSPLGTGEPAERECPLCWAAAPCQSCPGTSPAHAGAFFFFIFLKNKNFKNICSIGRQALSVIFFLQICNEVPGKKRTGRPPNGRQGGLSPPPPGDRGSPPYITSNPLFPPHLSPKIPPKIQKKERGEEKGSGEALPDCALVICR